VPSRTNDFTLGTEWTNNQTMFRVAYTGSWFDNIDDTLRAQQVYISQRGASLRFAPHLHVTEADIDQLAAALQRALQG